MWNPNFGRWMEECRIQILVVEGKRGGIQSLVVGWKSVESKFWSLEGKSVESRFWLSDLGWKKPSGVESRFWLSDLGWLEAETLLGFFLPCGEL